MILAQWRESASEGQPAALDVGEEECWKAASAKGITTVDCRHERISLNDLSTEKSVALPLRDCVLRGSALDFPRLRGSELDAARQAARIVPQQVDTTSATSSGAIFQSAPLAASPLENAVETDPGST